MSRIAAGYASSERKRRAWSDSNPGNELMRAELREALRAAAAPQLAGGGSVLDVGCGTGSWLTELREMGVEPARLHGVDLVPERLAEARERVPGAVLAEGNARALDFADGIFDLVLLFVVLSSLPDRAAEEEAVREARRVLARGGLLAVYDMRAPSPNPHVRRVTAARLRSLLGPDTEMRSLTVLPPLSRRLGEAARTLYRPLSRVPVLRTHWLALHRR